MKIALCTSTFLPIVDGVGRVVYEYAKGLSAKGHEVYVITPLQPAGYRGGLPFEIVDYTSMATPSLPQYRSGIAALDSHYIERIKQINFDIVHAHDPGPAGMEGTRLADKISVPLIGTFHSKYYDDIRNTTNSIVLSRLGARYVANYYKQCNETWTVSRNAAAELLSYGYKGDIEIVQNGCSFKKEHGELPDVKEEYALSGEILLYVGQIDRKKNIETIIRAASLVKKDYTLVLVGQGRDAQHFKELAESIGVKAVFTGHLFDSLKLAALYTAASVFVFPSLYDSAGLVVSEAAVYGTPSVVVSGSAPSEIISDGVNGLTCSNSPLALAQKINDFFDLPAEKRAHIGESARKSLPVSWKQVMDIVERRYRAVIAGEHYEE